MNDIQIDAARDLETWPSESETSAADRIEEFAQPDLSSVTERFQQIASKYPSAVAVHARGVGLTYSELNRAANRLARTLEERCGRAPQPVALLLDQDQSFLVALVAALKARKIYIPLDSTLPAARLNGMLDNGGARLILTSRGQLALAQQLQTSGRDILNLDQIPDHAETDLNLPVTLDDLVCIYYTSGSTGTPKGVAVSHRGLLRSVAGNISQISPGVGDRLALLGSTSFATTRWQIFGALLTGATVCLFDFKTEGAANLAEWMMREEITIYSSTPTLFRAWTATLEQQPETRFPKLRHIGLGGEPVLKRDFDAFAKYFADQTRFRIVYASTEGGSIANMILSKEYKVDGNILPVGRVIKGKQVSIVDEQDRILDIGLVGEIVVKSGNLPSGLWQAGELTQQAYTLDESDRNLRVFHTGDLGRFRGDGLLEFVGRKDDQVKIRGNRVELGEIETALLDLPGIRDACAAAREGRDGEQQLVAYVIGEPNAIPTPTGLRTALGDKLPNYMVPTAVVALEAFPMLPSGKIDRAALPAPDSTRGYIRPEIIAPRDRYELEMVQIWQDLLGVHPIGITDNFFDLGGHSVTAARLLVEIEKRYGQKFPPQILVNASTVAQLAMLLYDEGRQPKWSCVVPLRGKGTRPPLFYIPPFNSALGFYPLASHLDPDQPVYTLMASPTGEEFPFKRVEDEAAFYLQQIKTVQPQGPYYLTGWSYSAIVAFEVAQQVYRAGETVAFLGVLDIGIPERGLVPMLETLGRRARYFWSLGARGFAQHLSASVRRRFLGARAGAPKIQAEGPREEMLDELRLREDYEQIADRVGFRGYKGGKYPGRVTLFWTAGRHRNPKRDPFKGWSRIAEGGVTEVEIPGHHRDLLAEPYAEEIAVKLEECLSQTRSQPAQIVPS